MPSPDLPPSPHDDQVAAARAAIARSAVGPTGWSREGYLDLAEPIVRSAIEWQADSGAIIDPAAGEETVTCTARFIAHAPWTWLRTGWRRDITAKARRGRLTSTRVT